MADVNSESRKTARAAAINCCSSIGCVDCPLESSTSKALQAESSVIGSSDIVTLLVSERAHAVLGRLLIRILHAAMIHGRQRLHQTIADATNFFEREAALIELAVEQPL